MTIFEKNMDDESFQGGFFDREGAPADVDLTWIRPEMMEFISYDKKRGDVDFWFNDRSLYAPYVTMHANGDISASSLQAVKGHEDMPSVIRSFNIAHTATARKGVTPILGQNVTLPHWMYYKAKQLSKQEGGSNGKS